MVHTQTQMTKMETAPAIPGPPACGRPVSLPTVEFISEIRAEPSAGHAHTNKQLGGCWVQAPRSHSRPYSSHGTHCRLCAPDLQTFHPRVLERLDVVIHLADGACIRVGWQPTSALWLAAYAMYRSTTARKTIVRPVTTPADSSSVPDCSCASNNAAPPASSLPMQKTPAP
jgi:hypothetical protein